MPTDASLYQQTDNSSTPAGDDLRDDADHPRFPLAAPDTLSPLPVYLPLGVPGLVNPDYYQPAIAQTGAPLKRDGLSLANGIVSSSLFLDPDLANASVDTVLTEAFHKQYQLQRGAGEPGEPLLKLLAVLPLDEISLLAVPDATLPGWAMEANSQNVLFPPVLSNITLNPTATFSLSWTPVDGATGYELESSGDSLFGSSAIIWQGSATVDPDHTSLVQSGAVAQSSGCPATMYFRVRAQQGAITGPWSNTLIQALPIESFAPCMPATTDAPVLQAPLASRGRVVLEWTDPVVSDSYELQVGYEAAFALPETLYQGNERYFEVWSDPSRTAYFRVSATRAGAASPWSNTVLVPSDTLFTRDTMEAPEQVDLVAQGELLKIHQAMLRICAARADVFALLSLPREYSQTDCLLYKNTLISALASENGDTTLSFGAIAYPWLTVRDSSDDVPGAIRGISPEGSVLGSISALTLAKGAWLSPANQALQGVVDLDPHLDDSAEWAFFSNQLNLLTQQATGFLMSSSATLSPSSQLTEMNVRRLLILLRRLALREGVDYVFQPNLSSFWRIVQRRFEEVLRGLFLRGAFAGATQDESFRVTTNNTVNTQESVDQGQMVVELAIAPSLPLEFLTVRLVQTGGDLMFSEVV